MPFKKGDKNINRQGPIKKKNAPVHREFWKDEGLPPGLADMRFVYYANQKPSATETLGQTALRKLLADNPQKFLERMDELEKLYAEAMNRASVAVKNGQGDEASLHCPVTESVTQKIQTWLEKQKERAEYLWKKAGTHEPVVRESPERPGGQSAIPA